MNVIFLLFDFFFDVVLRVAGAGLIALYFGRTTFQTKRPALAVVLFLVFAGALVGAAFVPFWDELRDAMNCPDCVGSTAPFAPKSRT